MRRSYILVKFNFIILYLKCDWRVKTPMQSHSLLFLSYIILLTLVYSFGVGVLHGGIHKQKETLCSFVRWNWNIVGINIVLCLIARMVWKCINLVWMSLTEVRISSFNWVLAHMEKLNRYLLSQLFLSSWYIGGYGSIGYAECLHFWVRKLGWENML